MVEKIRSQIANSYLVGNTSLQTAVIIVVLLFAVKISSQNNYLSESDFDSIRFNGVPFASIQATRGQIQQMNSLFNTSLAVLESEDPGYNWRSFGYEFSGKEMKIGFSEIEQGQLKLTSITLTGANATVQVQNKTFKLGVKITDIMSSIANAATTYGDRIATFTTNDQRAYLQISYNATSKLIEEIVYFVPF